MCAASGSFARWAPLACRSSWISAAGGGNDPGRREQAEIDIVALCDEGEVLFAECKWREKLTDVDVLETLKHRSQLIPAEKRLLFLFSKSGLTEACCNRANAIGATLVSLDEVEL